MDFRVEKSAKVRAFPNTEERLRAVVDRVTEYGGTVLADTDLGAAIFIRDPDGQLIELLAG